MRYLSFFLFCVCVTGIGRAQLVVKAAVDHLVPDGIDNTGNIVLTVSGSTAPYTYTWNPGAIGTKDRSSISAGSYSLQVKSASSNTFSTVYNLGYKVQWTNTDRCTFRNDSLVSQTSATFNNVLFGSAVSKDVLPANTDGWVEYVLDNTLNQYLGFLDSLSPIASTYTDIDYGLLTTGNNLLSYQNGAQLTLSTAVKAGDVIRVERSSNTIIYKLNNIAVRTVTVSGISQKTFKVKGAITYNGRLLNVGCSFSQLDNVSFTNYIQMIPTLVHSSGPGQSNGSISLTPRQSDTYSYSWQPGGATGSGISSLLPGDYRCTVQNTLSAQSTGKYTVSNKVQWLNTNLCTFRNDSLIPAFTNYAYRATALSKNTLPAGTDGYAEYVLDVASGEDYHIGFLDNPSSNLSVPTDIDYGIYYYGTYKIIYSYENGFLQQLSNAARTGDVLRIEQIGNTVNYKVNGVTLRSITVAGISQITWKLKASLQPKTRLANIGTSFINTTNVSFPNFVRATPTVIHSSAPGLSDGRMSVSPLVAGSYTYSWQPGSSSTATQTALSAGSVSVTIADSDANKSTISCNLGYKTYWTNMDRCFSRNDSLISQAVAADIYATAASRNTLAAGADGWLEYRISSLVTNSHYIGFLDSLSPNANTVTDLDYSIRYNGANLVLYAFENGTFYNIYQSIQAGDLVRIERVGNTINYKVNGVTMRTVTVSGLGQKNLKLKACLQAVNSIQYVGCSFYDAGTISFVNYVRVLPVIRHSSGNNGTISLRPMVPYANSYLWPATSQYTNTISGLNPGVYSVRVADSLANQSTYKFTVANRTAWTGFTNAGVSQDTLTGTSTGDGAAYSNNVLAKGTDGWFSHVITSLSKSYYIGFADSLYGSPTTINDIDHGFQINGGNQFAFGIENGTAIILHYAPRIGDVASIERVADTINYKWNGVIFRKVTVTGLSQRNLKLKAVLNNKAQIVNVGMSVPRMYVSNLAIQDVGCATGQPTGSVSATVSGGMAPFSYAWDGVRGVNNYKTGLTTGTHTLEVTGADTYVMTQTFVIAQCPVWTSANAAVTASAGGNLTKSSGGDSWETGLMSTGVPFVFKDEPAWVSFDVADTLSSFMIGFRSVNADSIASPVNYKFYIENSFASSLPAPSHIHPDSYRDSWRRNDHAGCAFRGCLGS